MTAPKPEYVVDSSVAYRWFDAAGEESLGEAAELLRRHAIGEIQLIAPPIMPYEVLNALRCAGLSSERLRLAAEALAEADISLLGCDATTLGTAARIAVESGMTVYDASFVALAKVRNCELVTADRKAFSSIDECTVRLL